MIGYAILRTAQSVDPYQVWESRAAGADAILLIAEAIPECDVIDFQILATELGMTTLLEVHDVEHLLRSVNNVGFPHASYSLLGINNRDLHTFETTLATTERLAPRIPKDRMVVGESGLFTPADLARLARANVNAFLIGESLMRQQDVTMATRGILTRP